MRKLIAVLIILLVAVNVAYAEDKAEDSKTLAEINGVKITVADFESEIAALPANYRSVINTHKKKFLDEIIFSELLYQEAALKGVDKDPEVVEALEKLKRKVMAQKLASDVMKDVQVEDSEIEQYYKDNKGKFVIPEQVTASHILIKVDDPGDPEQDKEALAEASEILAKIKGGGDFAELAREYSACPSGAKGGSLDSFPRGRMVPEFDEAVFDLKPGEVSGVVKTQFGYHIIKVTEKQAAGEEPFDKVKESIRKELQQKKQKGALEKYAEGLKEKAEVKINEGLLQ